MPSLSPTATLADLQRFVGEVYALPDDRLYSIWDLLVQQQRFTMRALKGLRKGETDKIRLNLLISASWLMAIANRLHMNIDEVSWKRFPYLCSYCGERPCACKAKKPEARLKLKIDPTLKPRTIADFQKMFAEIYPPNVRTGADAGVHLAEEMGEMSEAIHNYLGQHQAKRFSDVEMETADYLSCLFGLASSAGINVALELSKMYEDGCHVCHQAPCICSFSEVAALTT